MRFDFASDNTAGLCPEAWAAMHEADEGTVPSYGEDPFAARAADRLRELFETDVDVYFVFNGTAANSLALASLCQSYHSVICHEAAHIATDECGAPEFFTNGTRLLMTPGAHAKLDTAAIEQAITRRRDMHFPKPRALSITQATELGTVYTAGEIGELTEVARRHDLRVHMDGARFANAVAALDCHPRELTSEVGVDVLCFGGTKLGMGLGEAVVFFDRSLSAEFAYRCKQAGQLASKMRYVGAAWARMLGDGSWLRYAAHANAMATRVAEGFSAVPSIEILHPVDANAVFTSLPDPVAAALRAQGWAFHDFVGGGSRFMCSWRTTEAEVDALIASAVRAG